MEWFWGQSRAMRCALLIALGALAGLGQAPQDAWYVALLALAGAFWLGQGASGSRQSAALWFWVGFGYFAVSFRWIIEPFLVDVARHGWMAPFAIVLMSAGIALFWAGAAFLGAKTGRGLGLIAALTLGEALRSYVFTGFPWASVGHIWIETPLLQLSANTGPHGLNFLTFALAGSLAALAHGRLLGAVLPILAAVAWGMLMPPPLEPADETRPLVRIVHPNIPQDEKWDPALRARNFNDLLRLSQSAEPVDFVIWPESAVTELMENAGPVFEVMSDVAGGATVITGVQRRRERQIYHNSFVVLGRGGEAVGLYDKQHLVPFGEYIPGGEIAARFGIRGLAATEGGGFSPGQGPDTLQVAGLGIVRPLICYEAIFPHEVRTKGVRPDVMIVVTNDAWFGRGAGPFQHLRQAQLLSATLGVPLIRSANSGVSAMIDGYGRVSDQLGLDTAGALDVRLPNARAETLYARYGDLPFLSACFVLFAAAFALRKKSFDAGKPTA